MQLTHILTLTFCLVACVACIDPEWEQWKKQYGKQYKNVEEEAMRRQIWETNKEVLKDIQGHLSFDVSLNGLSDMLTKELVKAMPYNVKAIPEAEAEYSSLPDKIPKSFDWRDHGVITPVKNQGECGNVEAIVVTECVESFHAIHSGHLVNLSVQQVQDCCCKGPACAGSYCPQVFRCIHKLGGLCSEQAYPPSPGRKPCKRTCKPVAQIKGARTVPRGNETSLQLALLHAPVFVAIDASQTSFQMYQSGIYMDPKCSSTQLDHALQLVGYGVMDGQDFWICKNSWGLNWGMKGYILMARNHNNMCGIASWAQVPI